MLLDLCSSFKAALYCAELSGDLPYPLTPPPALQGILKSVGGRPHYTLTDPAVCSADQRFGKADLGPEAIRNFKQRHTCGGACVRAGCRSTPA